MRKKLNDFIGPIKRYQLQRFPLAPTHPKTSIFDLSHFSTVSSHIFCTLHNNFSPLAFISMISIDLEFLGLPLLLDSEFQPPTT